MVTLLTAFFDTVKIVSVAFGPITFPDGSTQLAHVSLQIVHGNGDLNESQR